MFIFKYCKAIKLTRFFQIQMMFSNTFLTLTSKISKNVQFQKISIPTPWKVNGNSEGVGGLKSQNFKRKVWGLSGNSIGVGGKPKKPSMGGVWIFYGTTQSNFNHHTLSALNGQKQGQPSKC